MVTILNEWCDAEQHYRGQSAVPGSSLLPGEVMLAVMAHGDHGVPLSVCRLHFSQVRPAMKRRQWWTGLDVYYSTALAGQQWLGRWATGCGARPHPKSRREFSHPGSIPQPWLPDSEPEPSSSYQAPVRAPSPSHQIPALCTVSHKGESQSSDTLQTLRRQNKASGSVHLHLQGICQILSFLSLLLSFLSSLLCCALQDE